MTDCTSYTVYTPRSPAVTGSAGSGASTSDTVRVQISNFRVHNVFEVLADNRIFQLGSGQRAVTANRMTVLDGPAGIECTAWLGGKAKQQLGGAVGLGETADLVANVEEAAATKRLRCSF